MLGRLAAATAALTIVAIAPADAAIFCVKTDKCPKRGVSKSLKKALKAASESDKDDLVKVGAGTFPGGITMEDGDTLRGAGRSRTVFTGFVGVRGYDARAIAFTVRMKSTDTLGMDAYRGEIKRVRVDGTRVEKEAVGITLSEDGVARNVQVTLARGSAVSEGSFGGSIEDARLDAPTGIHVGYYGIDVARTVITATTGILAEDNALSLDAVAIRLRGENPVGIDIGGQDLGGGSVSARHVTIVGEGPGTGLSAVGGCGASESVTASFDQLVVDNLAVHVRRGSSCEEGGEANLTITRSAYDKNRVESAGPGTLSAEDPVTQNPKLGPDMVPTEGSQLIDAGATDEEPGRDAAGRPRPVGAAADIGAFEFQG